MIRRSGRRRHRAASACAVFAAIGVSTGLLGASLPQPAEAQPTDQNPLGGLVGGLLPLPSGSPPPSEQPPSEQPPGQEPEGSTSTQPAPSEQPPSTGNPSQNPLERLGTRTANSFRDDQPCADRFVAPCPDAETGARTMLGAAQKAWCSRRAATPA